MAAGMKRVLLRLSVVFAVFAATFVPAVSQAAPLTIQPGDSITSVGKGCTLGFAVTGGDNSYFMTAAHCVDNVGDDVVLDDGTVFADVVARGAAGELPETADDWSLMQVRSEYEPLVRGTVRGVAGTPTGYTTANEAALGDLVRFSGYGIPWFIDPILRENRYGIIVSNDAEIYTAIGLDTQGDSGGPILHQASGQALGLVSRLCVGLCTSEGPTVQGVLAKASAAINTTLTLKTA
jgi:hypothetical protein